MLFVYGVLLSEYIGEILMTSVCIIYDVYLRRWLHFKWVANVDLIKTV